MENQSRLYWSREIDNFPEEVTFETTFEEHAEADLVKSGQHGQRNALQSKDAVWQRLYGETGQYHVKGPVTVWEWLRLLRERHGKR